MVPVLSAREIYSYVSRLLSCLLLCITTMGIDTTMGIAKAAMVMVFTLSPPSVTVPPPAARALAARTGAPGSAPVPTSVRYRRMRRLRCARRGGRGGGGRAGCQGTLSTPAPSARHTSGIASCSTDSRARAVPCARNWGGRTCRQVQRPCRRPCGPVLYRLLCRLHLHVLRSLCYLHFNLSLSVFLSYSS